MKKFIMLYLFTSACITPIFSAQWRLGKFPPRLTAWNPLRRLKHNIPHRKKISPWPHSNRFFPTQQSRLLPMRNRLLQKKWYQPTNYVFNKIPKQGLCQTLVQATDNQFVRLATNTPLNNAFVSRDPLTIAVPSSQGSDFKKTTLYNVLQEFKKKFDGPLGTFYSFPSYSQNERDSYYSKFMYNGVHYHLPFSNRMKDFLIKITQSKAIPFGHFIMYVNKLLLCNETPISTILDSKYDLSFLQQKNSEPRALLEKIISLVEQKTILDFDDYLQLSHLTADLLKKMIMNDRIRFSIIFSTTQLREFSELEAYKYVASADTITPSFDLPHLYHGYFRFIDTMVSDQLVPDVMRFMMHDQQINNNNAYAQNLLDFFDYTASNDQKEALAHKIDLIIARTEDPVERFIKLSHLIHSYGQQTEREKPDFQKELTEEALIRFNKEREKNKKIREEGEQKKLKARREAEKRTREQYDKKNWLQKIFALFKPTPKKSPRFP
ncbi:MAG: hypothetical protein WBQ73_01715 [Candidatus Babeliales bacterium]